MALGPNTLREMLHTMQTIRRFEERASDDYRAGKIFGVVHCYIGEEAIAVGVCGALRESDQIISTHRGHGHCIAKGADLDRMMAELYGKRDGYCKGKGGSMHIADFEKGMLGANGIVAGGMSIVTGAGLAAKLEGKGGVAVSFFGDGASAAGPFHECLNISTAWKLPVIYVCENNTYAAQTPASTTIARGGEIARRADGYGIPGISVDGNNIEAVHAVAEQAVARARAGEGPTLIEARTYRWRAHTERAGQPDYRPKDEIAAWKEPAKDPIQRLVGKLKAEHGFSDRDFEELDRQVLARLEEACKFAESSPFPAPDDALEDVFAA
ncbi:MAG: thiamine pyrophosphate-dependent dehydrogenase E1 component subunit alpha [Hyphomicrobiaceae bacterium]